MGLLERLSPALRRQVEDVRSRAAREERELIETAARDEAREKESRLRGEDLAVEQFTRYGLEHDLAKVPEHRRKEALRRREEVVERIRARDREDDERAVPGLRSAFPRMSRL